MDNDTEITNIEKKDRRAALILVLIPAALLLIALMLELIERFGGEAGSGARMLGFFVLAAALMLGLPMGIAALDLIGKQKSALGIKIAAWVLIFLSIALAAAMFFDLILPALLRSR